MGLSLSVNSALKLKPFNGTNYTLWTYKTKMWLMSNGLFDVVNGE